MPRRKTPYRSKVKIGEDANGKPINKWIQGSTRDELAAARRDVIRRFILGDAQADDRIFGEYATEWYNLRKAPFVSPSSRESYRTALNKDILPVFGNAHLRAVTAADIQAFVNRFADMSNTKITVIIATLRGIFDAAVADRILTQSPAEHIRRPKAAPPAEKPALTPDQRAALEDVCRTHPQGHYLALMYYLGVRPGEARGLQWRDIDFKAALVHVERDIDYKAGNQPGALKTAKSTRTIPMPRPLANILKPLTELPHNYIVHGSDPAKPLSKASAERLWTDIMIMAGMVEPTDKAYRASDPRAQWQPTITPHALRHNFITMCWENGLDVYETMKLVGHTSIKTTMDIYTHLSAAQMQKTAVKLDAMFGQKATPKVAEKLHQPK